MNISVSLLSYLNASGELRFLLNRPQHCYTYSYGQAWEWDLNGYEVLQFINRNTIFLMIRILQFYLNALFLYLAGRNWTEVRFDLPFG